VKSLARSTVLLVATTVLTWHGLLLSTPHTHGDNAVPREELACSASHPFSQTNHLHGSGQPLSPHPCVACFLGSAVADTLGVAEIETVAVGVPIFVVTSSDLRSRLHSSLPLLRGPPLTA